MTPLLSAKIGTGRVSQRLHWNQGPSDLTMAIFDFLFGKKPKVTNNALVNLLTKSIIKSINDEPDNFEEVVSLEDKNSKFEDPGVSFYIAKYDCFEDSDGSIYGWICIQYGDADLLTFNLIRHFPKKKGYISYFDCEFKKPTIIKNPRFAKDSVLYACEDSTQQCMDMITKYARLASYSSPPPYVIFAKMINISGN